MRLSEQQAQLLLQVLSDSLAVNLGCFVVDMETRRNLFRIIIEQQDGNLVDLKI